jgi:hypothetical protein
MNKHAIRQADKITRELWPTISAALGGQPVVIQGMVLADLTAMWLAGHVVDGNPKRSSELRERLLESQTDAIRDLAAMYAVGER